LTGYQRQALQTKGFSEATATTFFQSLMTVQGIVPQPLPQGLSQVVFPQQLPATTKTVRTLDTSLSCVQ
jgi:hypothetical protein